MNRLQLNEPNWLGPAYTVGLVDEIVVENATVHLEMLDGNGAYLIIQSAMGEVHLRLRAERNSRRERAQELAACDDRLRDRLMLLLPGRCHWFLPWWKRPFATVRGWWNARRDASVSLRVSVYEQDGDLFADSPQTPKPMIENAKSSPTDEKCRVADPIKETGEE